MVLPIYLYILVRYNEKGDTQRRKRERERERDREMVREGVKRGIKKVNISGREKGKKIYIYVHSV